MPAGSFTAPRGSSVALPAVRQKLLCRCHLRGCVLVGRVLGSFGFKDLRQLASGSLEVPLAAPGAYEEIRVRLERREFGHGVLLRGRLVLTA